jgi:hypothetical protein
MAGMTCHGEMHNIVNGKQTICISMWGFESPESRDRVERSIQKLHIKDLSTVS